MSDEGLFGSLAQMFAEGGFVMYPIALLACALPALAAVLLTVTLVSKRNALTFAAILYAGSLAVLATGVVGKMRSLRASEEAIATAHIDDQQIIRFAATGESMAATVFGYGAAILPMLFAGVLFGIGLSRLERFKSKA